MVLQRSTGAATTGNTATDNKRAGLALVASSTQGTAHPLRGHVPPP